MGYLDRLRRQNSSRDYEIIVGDRGNRLPTLSQSMLLPQVRAVAIPAASEYSEAFDICAQASRGNCLLFVRDLVDLDLAMLDRSIRDLEDSGNELSVSDTGKFVLVRRSLYGRVGCLHALLQQVGVDDRAVESDAQASSHRVSSASGTSSRCAATSRKENSRLA